MNDPEHAKAVAQWQSDNDTGEKKKFNPPWNTWSPEVERLAGIEDELRQLRSTLIAVNGGKPGKMEPVERPTSMVAEEKKKADYQRKKKVHDRLVSKMLPNKAE